MMRVPHPIPYQGSKRRLADTIIAYFPEEQVRLFEPFAGSAAVTLRAGCYGKAREFVLSDSNEALMGLWDEIINRPQDIAGSYEQLWNAQQGREREFYDWARDQFNATKRPDYFLYLLARCVKGAVRYNSNGEFNQSPDNRRRGARPDTMRQHILGASGLLRDRTRLECCDYRNIVFEATPVDLIYMDPPYQGVCGTRDPRYISEVQFDEFVDVLGVLNESGSSFIISYDGRNDLRTYGRPLPQSLELLHLEVNAGTSTQATLLGRRATTVESLYLSPALADRLGGASAARDRAEPQLARTVDHRGLPIVLLGKPRVPQAHRSPARETP